ncbi:MAG: M48 family metallopeptidase [Acidobacteria bacterium]|nr:M48 family metallopeptidase [Acidobacteriota bacterium]
MANFEALQRKNFRRSLLLVAALFAVLTALVYAVGTFIGGVSSGVLTAFAVVFSAGSSALSWWQSDRLVLAMTKAKIAEPERAPQLHNVVEEVAIAAGLPKPRVAVVDDPAPNAFATGRDPDRAVVAVTTGLLERMDRDELQAVVAHEMAHVANRDTLMMSVAAATAGVIALVGDFAFRLARGSARGGRSRKGGGALLLPVAALAPFAAGLLKAALSRSREGLADATAVAFTRNPAALRSALGKLAADSTVVRARSSSVAHLWIECPLDLSSPLNRLYSTHPPITERIAALWRLEGGAGAPPPTPGYAPDHRDAGAPVRGFGLLVASGALFASGLSAGAYSGVVAAIGQLCMFASPLLAFAAYWRLGKTPAGVRWLPLTRLALLISGAIVAQRLGSVGMLAVGAMLIVLLAGRRRGTGSGTPPQVSADVLSSAVHALDARSAASGPAPKNGVLTDAPVKNTELESWAAAASAKWVKWTIGIAAVVFLTPAIALGLTEINFEIFKIFFGSIGLAVLAPLGPIGLAVLALPIVAVVMVVRRRIKSRRARKDLPSPRASTGVPD